MAKLSEGGGVAQKVTFNDFALAGASTVMIICHKFESRYRVCSKLWISDIYALIVIVC